MSINMKALLDRALEKGFSDVEIYSEVSKRASFSVFKGELDKYSVSEPMGIAIRGIYKGKMGNAYTEKTDEAALEALLDDCLSNAEIIETEESVYLYEPQDKTPVYINLSKGMAPISERIELIKGLEREAEASPYCDQLQNQYGDFESTIRIVNSKGLDVSYSSGIGYLYLSPIMKKGDDTKNEFAMTMFTEPEGLKARETMREAMYLTEQMFGAEVLPSGKYETVLSNKAMSSLLEVMAGIFSAEAADKGLSAFKDKVGQSVAADLLSIIEDPTLEGGIANVPFDGEGVPTQRKALIENGVLTGFQHNLKTAAKYKVAPTGNGFKPNFKSPVGIGATNVFIPKGEKSLEALLADVKDGLYITALEGLHAGINGITGNFSLACRGRRIENGQMTSAVHQMTVSGNYFELLQAVKAIADDLVFESMDTSAVYGSPSVWVSTLSFAGK